jgi:hypothetical protein
VNERVRAVGGACLVAGTVLGAPLLRRWYRHWGATPAERSAPMPGDDLLPEPKLQSTRAVTICAPCEQVWPWLAQVGQGRGGLYSYDVLEDLIGCDIHSADAILPEHQDLGAGDLIRMGPDGYPCYRVASLDPGRSLVLLGADPSTHEVPTPPIAAAQLGSSWQWQLLPVGEHTCRLLVRQQNTYPPAQAVLWHLVEPISFVMERAMLLGIRDRVEARAALLPAAPLHATTGGRP